MKVISLPNDLEDGSLSILICLGPLLLRSSLLKFDVFTRYRNVHSVLKKCIVDGKLLHLQPSNFIDSYSTEEERVEFVAIKTKKEIADEKLNPSEAKKIAEQILRNSLLSAYPHYRHRQILTLKVIQAFRVRAKLGAFLTNLRTRSLTGPL